MRLQLCKPTSPDSGAVTQNARHGDLGIFVENGLRDATKESKGRDVAITKRLGCLGWIPLHKHRIRMWKAHHVEVDLAFHASNYTKGLSKIHLRMDWTVRQRHKHLFGAPLLLTHVIRHCGQAASIPMLVRCPTVETQLR